MTHVVGDPGHTTDHNTIEATQATHTTQIAALPGTYVTPPGTPTSGGPYRLPFFNVKNYGAKGDYNGTTGTDDTAAIQAALDACDTALGGVVYFPQGIYLSGPLTAHANTILQGVGPDLSYNSRGSRLRLKDASNAPLFTIAWGGATSVRWYDLHLEGANAGQAATSHGIYFQEWPAVTSQTYAQSHIVRCHIKGFRDAGVWVGKGWEGVFVTDSFASNNLGDGVRLEASDCTVDNCHILSNGGDGVRLGGSSNAVLGCGSISGNTGHGVSVRTGGVSATTFTQGAFVADHQIADNHIDRNYSHGVYVQGANVRVSDNIVGANSRSGSGNFSNVYFESTLSDASASFGLSATDNTFINLGDAWAPAYHLNINGTSTVVTTGGNTFDTTAGSVSVAAYPASGSGGSHVIGDHIAGHFTSVPGLPTVAAGANNGTTPPGPTLTDPGSTDMKGQGFFGSGTGPAAGQQVTVTFKRAFALAPAVMVVAGNPATATLFASGLTINVSTTSFSIVTTIAPAASQANGTYQFFYMVMG